MVVHLIKPRHLPVMRGDSHACTHHAIDLAKSGQEPFVKEPLPGEDVAGKLRNSLLTGVGSIGPVAGYVQIFIVATGKRFGVGHFQV